MGTARPVRQGRQAWEDDRQWVAVVRGHEVIYKGKSCPQAAMHLKPGMHFGKGENVEEAIREGRAAARVQVLAEMECSARSSADASGLGR